MDEDCVPLLWFVLEYCPNPHAVMEKVESIVCDWSSAGIDGVSDAPAQAYNIRE